jgi:hypothetical protein
MLTSVTYQGGVNVRCSTCRLQILQAASGSALQFSFAIRGVVLHTAIWSMTVNNEVMVIRGTISSEIFLGLPTSLFTPQFSSYPSCVRSILHPWPASMHVLWPLLAKQLHCLGVFKEMFSFTWFLYGSVSDYHSSWSSFVQYSSLGFFFYWYDSALQFNFTSSRYFLQLCSNSLTFATISLCDSNPFGMVIKLCSTFSYSALF